MKIYSDDTNLPYKTTTKRAIDSKRDIDAELARYGITKTFWDWNIEHNIVELKFQFSERFKDTEVSPVVALKPPVIWEKRGKKSRKPDEIDWRLSMRLMHWYIKNALAWSYSNQSERFVAFLPYIMTSEQKTVKDVILNIEQLSNLKALPDANDKKIIDQ